MEENTKKIRLRGFAEANGVGFEAGIDTGITTVSDVGKFAAVKEDGTLSCSDFNFEDNIPEMSMKIYKWGKVFRIASVILAIVCLIGYFMNAIYSTGENYLGFSMAYVFLGLSFVSQGAVVGLGRFLGNRDMEQFAKFAGAKNAVVNFFYDNNRIPTMEEVKASCRVTDRPDYVENASLASILIILGACRLLPGAWFLLGAIVFGVLMFVLEPGVFKRFWQRIATTSDPEDVHCNAAIKALENAVKWTEKVSVKVSKKQVSIDDFIEKMGHVFEEEKCSKCHSYKQCKEMWERLTSGDEAVYIYEVTMTCEEEE